MNKKDAHILFLINSLSHGGAENVFINDINALSKLGFKCSIAFLYSGKCDADMVSRLAINESSIWRFNFKSLYDPQSYFSLVKKIRREKISIVYSTLDNANFAAKIVRIFASFKLFCREANMTEDKPLKFKIADIVLNFLVHKLVMVAEAVKDSYASYDPFHRGKMAVLYNGVSIPADTAHSIKPGNPIKIIAVGSFTPKKGFEDLVMIFKDYVYNDKNFRLEIIGDGILFDKISSEIKEYRMDDKIQCLGSMSHDSLKNHYLDSQIFALTSKKEGCPNVLLEAASFGLASVCFSVGAVPEIIENNVSGIFVPKGDREAFGMALNNLLENPEKIISMGKLARQEIIKRFSSEVHLKNLLNTLELKI